MSSIFKTRFQNRTIFELNRVVTLHSKLPSDALRLRARELIRSAKISEATFLPYSDTAAFAEALMVLGVGFEDIHTRIALYHAKHHFTSSCGASVAFLISTLGAASQKVKGTDFKDALLEHMLHAIQTLSSSDLSLLFRAMAKAKATDKVLWGCIADQLQQEIGSMDAETISSSLFCMAFCKFYPKEYVDECEQIVLSSQLNFSRDDLMKVIEAFRTFNRPVLNIQLLLKRVDVQPAQVVSAPTHTKILDNPTTLPSRQHMKVEAPLQKTSTLSLTLSEKEALDRKVRMVLPNIPLQEIVTVIATTRQKGAETIAQIQMAISAVSTQLKTTRVDAELAEDITLLFIRSPFLSVPEISYGVEDLLKELYEQDGIGIINMEENFKDALRQVSVLTDAVEMLPRLRATRLIGSLLEHIKRLGPLYERVLGGKHSSLPLASVPSYVFHTVRLLSACNSTEALDANRGAICQGIHGLAPAKAASLALTVARLPNPPSHDGRPPLNIALLDAIVDVLLQRGVKGFPPTMSCQIIEALSILKVNKTILVLNLMEEIASSARGLLMSAGSGHFDIQKCITAARRGMSMLSSENHGLTFQEAKGAAVDTVTIVLRSSEAGIGVLCEGLRIMATVITCDAARVAAALRRKRTVIEDTSVMRMEQWMGEVGLAKPWSPTAGANDVTLVEDLARRLRATLDSATAPQIVSLLASLSMLRQVPQLQHPLLTKELTLLGVEHAIQVLGSASANVLNELVVATKEMELPFEVLDRFRTVCGKALLRGMERESSDSTSQWTLEKACSFANAAYFITVHSLDCGYYVPSRFGAVLWNRTKALLEKERSSVPIDNIACVLFLIAVAYQDGHIDFSDAELKFVRVVTAAAGRNPQSSPLSLASLTLALTLFGVPMDVHPLKTVVSNRRLELLGHTESMDLLARKGHDAWLGVGRDLSNGELTQMSTVINDALKRNLSKAAQKDAPLFDIKTVHESFTKADALPQVRLVNNVGSSQKEFSDNDFVIEDINNESLAARTKQRSKTAPTRGTRGNTNTVDANKKAKQSSPRTSSKESPQRDKKKRKTKATRR